MIDIKIEIKNAGYLLNINGKEFRSPVIFDVKSLKEKNKIENYLISKGIKYRILVKEKPFKLSQLKYKFGYIKDRIDERDYSFKTVLSSKLSTTPMIKDYTSLMSPVKDQRNAGTCVGFAVAAVKEYQEQQEYLSEKKSGSKYERKEKHYDLSEQWIYYKSKEIDPWPNQEGTSIRDALKQLCKLGVPPEKGWLYNDIIKGKPEVWAKSIARWGKGQEYYRINNLNELLTALTNVGPVVIGILCFEEIMNPQKGLVKYPINPNRCYGGHAITCVGFSKKTKLIKFKNSWSRNWGDNGYGYLPFKYIENYMIDAWALIDINIKNIMRG